MKLSTAATIWIDYHRNHSKKKHAEILPSRHWTILQGIRWQGDWSSHPGWNSNVPQPPHRWQQTLYQAGSLLPIILFFQLRAEQYRLRISESMRYAYDPETLPPKRNVAVGNHRKRDYWRNHISNDQESQPIIARIDGPRRNAYFTEAIKSYSVIFHSLIFKTFILG